MTETTATSKRPQGLRPYLSPIGVWSLSLGTSIGWGSFVITSNTYLSNAGPFGSVIGTILGAAVMLVIGRSYFYLLNRYPDAGGVYAYTKAAFGSDRAFLISWFLSLTYVAIFWANATSLPLFARYFLGKQFQFGKLYKLFGYNVWLGEALLSIGAILIIGFLCMRSKRIPMALMVIAALTFVIGISVCFLAAMILRGGHSFEPAFIPESSVLAQVTRIALLSPWAFVGFENISHSVEEFRFPRGKTFRVMTAAIVSATLLYVFVTLLSVTAYPPEYDSWLSYIRNLGNISGIRGLPAFYAAHYYLGSTGVTLLMLSLLALILTSLIGNLIALSRLFFALAKDRILPDWVTHLNGKGIPDRGILLVILVSLVIPFLGRTAIGWIVDVTTIGATLIYGFTSASAFKLAKKEKNRPAWAFGLIGLTLMILFGIVLLLPDLFFGDSMATESYFIFILWSVLGIFFFRWIMSRDRSRRYGRSLVVWLTFLTLIAFMSMVWIYRLHEEEAAQMVIAVHSYDMNKFGFSADQLPRDPYISWVLSRLHRINLMTTFAVIALFLLALGAMLWNSKFLRLSEEQAKQELGSAKRLAYTDPLTGVKSKLAYVEAEERLDRRIAEGTVESFAAMVFDLNGLKLINDTLGHEAGDLYITTACRLICNHFKHSPVFRIGGDEFAVILEGQDYQARSTLQAVFDRKMEENLHAGEVVIASGLSDYVRGQDNSYHAVFERADEAMYQRKRALKELGAVTRL